LMFAMSFYSVYFSKNLAALDSLDFWVGQTLIFIIATWEIMMFSWSYGAEKLVKDANAYSLLKLPKQYAAIWKYFTPTILLLVFFGWLLKDVLGVFGGKLSYQIENLASEPAAQISFGVILFLIILFGAMIFKSKQFKEEGQ
ncbi:MAG: hypothetical protein IKO42_05650, partial [Opitutales bacterium]|nr:hypothetical protein [Opitutales bacterium]